MVHRRIGDLDVHLVVNTGPHPRTQRVVRRERRAPGSRCGTPQGRRRGQRRRPTPERPGSRSPWRRTRRWSWSATTGTRRRSAVRAAGQRAHDRVGPSPPAGGSSGPTAPTWARSSSLIRWEDDPRIGPDFSGTLAYVDHDQHSAARRRVRLDLGDGRVGRRRGGPAGRAASRATPTGCSSSRRSARSSGCWSTTCRWRRCGRPPYACDLTDRLAGRREAVRSGWRSRTPPPTRWPRTRPWPAGWPTRSAGTAAASGCRPSSGPARA